MGIQGMDSVGSWLSFLWVQPYALFGFIQAHIIKFLQLLSEYESISNIAPFLNLVKFLLMATLQDSNASHLIMYMIVDLGILPCYVYIHEDDIS